MRKWSERPLIKVLLVATVYLTAVAAVLIFSVLTSFVSSVSMEDIFTTSNGTYEDSKTFQTLLSKAADDVLEQAALTDNYQTDGVYNPDKLVDIIAFDKTGEINGDNASGLAYTVQQLVEWNREYEQNQDVRAGDMIVACQKADGTNYYYYLSEFTNLIVNGNLVPEQENVTIFLQNIESGLYDAEYRKSISEQQPIVLRNENHEVAYTDCWTFTSAMQELYAPQGASNLLEVVNQSQTLNGRLPDIYEKIKNAMSLTAEQVSTYEINKQRWGEGNTNLTYLLVDYETGRMYTDSDEFQDSTNVEASVQRLISQENQKYVVVRPKLADFQSNLDVAAGDWKNKLEPYDVAEGTYLFVVSVNTQYPIQDMFSSSRRNYETYAPVLRGSGMKILVLSIVCVSAIACLGILTAGEMDMKKKKMHTYDRRKMETAVLFVLIPWGAMTFLFRDFLQTHGQQMAESLQNLYAQDYLQMNFIGTVSVTELCVIALYTAFSVGCFLLLFLSFIRRYKRGTLYKNSLLHKVLRQGKFFWANRSVISKATLFFVIFLLAHWILALFQYQGHLTVFLIFLELGCLYYIIRRAVELEEIRKGIEEIASGNVDHKIDIHKVSGENRQIAVQVNDIGNGLQRAVEENRKSEQLKTSLITNVSHDIKTPLTSIINYVDLLKREDIQDEKVKEYLNILEAKANRLKILTDDVVEASKASSGNITLECANVNLVEMLNQVEGEFSETMAEQELDLVVSLPETPAIIYADGRRLWRVLANVFNNAVKYAMPKTRVYADLQVADKEVVFSLKNISKQRLNISADELMERFVQGDISRGTEGSGLGLSIAKTLTELQGGKFELHLDGDLFKVNIIFPCSDLEE